MFSSGTTGVPKCIVHGHGGTLLQHLKEHQLHTNISSGDRVFYFTTCSWMMWNWLVSALATQATIMLYDGSPFYPDDTVLWRFANDEQFTHFGTSAKYIETLMKNNVKPRSNFKLKNLRTICSTGSPLSPESYDFVYKNIGSVHLASISGGTDIVSCFVLGIPTLPVRRGEIQGPGLGMAVEIWNDAGQVKRGKRGELVCTKPFPSRPVKFWNDPDRKKYYMAYFDRFADVWAHGDFAEKTVNGGYIIHGRSDATLNPGGVRIGTAEIYRQVDRVDEVLESIVIGQTWENDIRIILFVKLKEGINLCETLVDTIKKTIKDNCTVRHVPSKILQVNDIPRTKSGKIVEIPVRDIVHGKQVKNKEALANPEALDFFKDRPELALK
jgi:acetoacetyl-CoA synthetase